MNAQIALPVPMDQSNARVAYIRIDNLPPGKTWRQVKYLVGGMVHHTNILQVKMLPPVQSIVPPFMPFQSCIVSLKRSDSQLNRLLIDLNGYTWDYYRLVAYAVPPLHTPNGGAMGEQAPPMMMPYAPMPTMYFPSVHQSSFSRQLQQSGKKMKQVFSEESFRKQMTARGMWQLLLEGFPPCLHWDVSSNDTSRRASQLEPTITIRTSHPEKYGKLKWTVLKDFIKLKCHKLLEMDSTGATANTREFYVGVYEAQEVNVDVDLKVDESRPNPAQDSNQVHSESQSGTNPPHDTPQEAEEAKHNDQDHYQNQNRLQNQNYAEDPEKDNAQSRAGTQNRTASGKVLEQEEDKANGEKKNTEEPNGGIPLFEASELENHPDVEDAAHSLEQLSLQPSHRVVSATIYKAIVGFHSRELCDMCLESLQGQEYSLGYVLNVTELPAYEW